MMISPGLMARGRVQNATAWRLPTATVNPDAWTNVLGLLNTGGSYAQKSLAGGAGTQLIGRTFGFSADAIPSGAYINGVEFRLYGQADQNSEIRLDSIQIYKDAFGSADFNYNFPGSTYLTTSDQLVTIGGIGYGAGLTKAEVEAANFGVGCNYQDFGGATNTVLIDYYETRIHYLAAP